VYVEGTRRRLKVHSNALIHIQYSPQASSAHGKSRQLGAGGWGPEAGGCGRGAITEIRSRVPIETGAVGLGRAVGRRCRRRGCTYPGQTSISRAEEA
jgi:hypothetical protein